MEELFCPADYTVDDERAVLTSLVGKCAHLKALGLSVQSSNTLPDVESVVIELLTATTKITSLQLDVSHIHSDEVRDVLKKMVGSGQLKHLRLMA